MKDPLNLEWIDLPKTYDESHDRVWALIWGEGENFYVGNLFFDDEKAQWGVYFEEPYDFEKVGMKRYVCDAYVDDIMKFPKCEEMVLDAICEHILEQIELHDDYYLENENLDELDMVRAKKLIYDDEDIQSEALGAVLGFLSKTYKKQENANSR